MAQWRKNFFSTLHTCDTLLGKIWQDSVSFPEVLNYLTFVHACVLPALSRWWAALPEGRYRAEDESVMNTWRDSLSCSWLSKVHSHKASAHNARKGVMNEHYTLFTRSSKHQANILTLTLDIWRAFVVHLIRHT